MKGAPRSQAAGPFRARRNAYRFPTRPGLGSERGRLQRPKFQTPLFLPGRILGGPPGVCGPIGRQALLESSWPKMAEAFVRSHPENARPARALLQVIL